MEWKDVTPAGAKEKKHYRLSCWLLSFNALAVLRFIASCGSLLSIEALKKALATSTRSWWGFVLHRDCCICRVSFSPHRGTH